MTTAGLITALTVEDDTLIGSHVLSFEAYFTDFDYSPEYTKELDFTLRVTVENALTELQKTLLLIIEGTLTRFQPISVEALAPRY